MLEAVEASGRAQSAATWGTGVALLAARLARRVSRLYVYRYSQPAGTDVHGRLINYTGNFYINHRLNWTLYEKYWSWHQMLTVYQVPTEP